MVRECFDEGDVHGLGSQKFSHGPTPMTLKAYNLPGKAQWSSYGKISLTVPLLLNTQIGCCFE